MMRSKKKRQQKGQPEPSKYHCIACERLRQDMFPFPAVDQEGNPILGPDGKQIEQVGEMCIDMYSNYDVNVRHFHQDHGTAMMFLCNALMKVSEFFTKIAAQQAKQSPLMLAKPGASIEDIEKMRRNN